MHLLRFNPEDKTLREVPPGEFAADPACRYFYVQGKRAAVPIATPDGIGEIVWQHPDYQPPSPANAMTDQHRATDEQWAEHENYASSDVDSSCILELRHRVEALETHIAAIEPLAARTQAATGSALHLALVTSKLGHRVEALEATQHAHIEAKASEAGARCAVEQLRSRPGSWQPIKTEITYGSDASIPALSEHRAPDEWVGHHLATARTLVRNIGSRPVTVEGSFDMGGQSYSYKTEAVPTAEPTADARQLTLVERVARRLARFASEGRPGDDATPIASAVLCDVADWLAEGSGRSGSWNTPAADLRHEANR